MTDITANGFTVKLISENEDGSANIEIEAGPEMKDKFFSEGITFLLIKGILEGTTEDIFRWAQRGKEEENTDKLVDKFAELYNEDTK